MAFAKLTNGNAALIVAVIYVYGVIVALFTLVPSWALSRSWPDWAWWQFLLAPFGLGILAAVLEWVFAPIPKWLEWGNKDAPQWKRAASFFVVFGGGVALIFVPLLVREWWSR